MQAAEGARGLPSSLSPELARRRSAGLYRAPRIVDAGENPAPWLTVDGRRCLGFCSNDYLGLARDPRLGEAMAAAAGRWGAGAGAAHLVGGHTREHAALEEELADWTGRERALLFSTGYMANLGVLQALASRRDRILEDRLNHASLLDAARLTGAVVRRYRHADAGAVLDRLAAGHGREKSSRTLVVTDGVFSMDGDVAPVGALARHCRAHGAWLVVDDAHGLGVVGDDGGGVTAGHASDEVPVLVGTLGKALGCFGAFVAGDRELIETLMQAARTWIYTTAPPPAVAAAVRRALGIARAEAWRRAHLTALRDRFRAGARDLGLTLLPSDSPIQPVMTGSTVNALDASGRLLEQGLWVAAIRPPTVPEGTARLRVSLSAAHTEEHVDRLLDGLADCRLAATKR